LNDKDTRAILDDLAAIDPHVELSDFRNAQIAQRIRSDFHCILRGILPGIRAGAIISVTL
jgi:hypothetical protein